MSEGQQTAAASGIDYSRLGFGDDVPGVVPLVEVKTPHRVVFGIDALGQWRIEVHGQDGTPLDAAWWWMYAVDDDGTEEDADGAVVPDLSAYPVDSPAGAVQLQAELQRRFPDAEVVWKPGVMNSLDEHAAAAHHALAAAAAERTAARRATAAAEKSLREALPLAQVAEKSLREALPLAQVAKMGASEIAERTGYARSTVTKALENLTTAPGSTTVPAPAQE